MCIVNAGLRFLFTNFRDDFKVLVARQFVDIRNADSVMGPKEVEVVISYLLLFSRSGLRDRISRLLLFYALQVVLLDEIF